MKKPITKKLLKRAYARESGGFRAVFFLAVLFCVMCLVFTPVYVGGPVTLVLAVIAAMIWLRSRRLGESGNPAKGYLKLRPLTAKEQVRRSDADDAGTTRDYWEDWLLFGSDRVRVRRDAYEAAREGALYYLACFSGTDAPFACFPAEDYEPGPDLELRP